MGKYKYDLGEYVMTKKYSYEGRIVKRYHTIPRNKDWQAKQIIKLTEEELRENWYFIEIMYSGYSCGSVCVSESDII